MNFAGADQELRELCEFLEHQKKSGAISEFCSASHVEWRFIPGCSPNFGGKHLSRATTHLKLIIMELVNFTYVRTPWEGWARSCSHCQM